MEGDSTESKKFSYPNADRTLNDTGEITGPAQPEAPKLTQEQLRQTVHLNEALNIPSSEKTSDMQNIRTYQSDVANAVKTDNVSLIKIALAEKKRQDRQGTYDQVLGSPSSKSGLYIGIGIIVLLLIGSGVFIWLGINAKAVAPVVDTTSISTPTFETEKTILLNIAGKDSNDIEKAIQTEKTADLSLGSMERVKFVNTDSNGINQELTAQDWLSFLKIRAPDSLLRSFDQGFIFGIYSLTPHDSFAILKVNSYDNAYAGMLAWEPNMEDDIGGIIINPRPLSVIGQDGAVSTTTLSQFNGKPFVDRIINNKDARVLLDDNGNIKILYTFIDQNTLVIASGESVLKEVVFRLTTGRISR